MAVFGNAHRAVQPIGRAALGGAVIARRLLDAQGQRDADLRARILNDDGVVGDLAVALGGERGRKAIRRPGLVHECARLGQVLLPLRRGRGGRIHRRERRIIAKLRAPVEQPVHQAGPIQAERHGAADARIGEGRPVTAHMQMPLNCRRQRDGAKARIRQQPLRALHGQAGDDIDPTRLQRQDLRRLCAEKAEHRARGLGRRAPIMRVAHESGARMRCVAFQPERSGADEMPLVRAIIMRRQHDGVVIVRRHVIGEMPVWRIEVEGHGRIVDALRSARREHAAEHGQRVGSMPRVGQAVHGGHHVRRCERRAVVKGHVRAQRKGPNRSVAIGPPARRQHRPQPAIGAVEGQELARLAQHQRATGLRHGQWIDGAGGRGCGDADRGARRSRFGGACRRRQQRCRDAQPCRLGQQVAPAQLSGAPKTAIDGVKENAPCPACVRARDAVAAARLHSGGR